MPFHCLKCKAEIDSAFRACPHCGEAITEFSRKYTNEPLDGKYELMERLGAGGMGQVYKAVHKLMGATRVIKVIHPMISESRDAHDRFLREARAATKVNHPNVATVYDFAALPDGSHYMVWEYIDGENLAQRLKTRGTLPPRQAVRIVIQALHGLEAIHRAGIIHRDISPENVMLTSDDTAKIIDLGVAKLDDPTESAATRTGIFVGKLRYASPEQLGILGENEKIDGRADIYSTGMVLYELLTGRPPYEAKSPHEYFLIHTRDQETTNTLELPSEMPGGTALKDVLRRALARDRNQRYATAREFANALEEVERTLPDPRAMPTMALPYDGDETMKVKPATVDTLHRETVRTSAPDVLPATPPPPPPASPAGVTEAATLLTPLPVSGPPVPVTPQGPPARLSGGIKPIYVVLFVALIGIAAIAAGVLLVPKVLKRFTDKPAVTDTTQTVTTTTTTQAATVATASVNVVNTTSEPTATIVEEPVTTTTAPPVIITTTTASPTPPRTETIVASKPPVRVDPTPPRRDEPEDSDEPSTPAVFAGEYVDGGGDDSANKRAIERLRQQLRGVKTIEVHGGSMQDVLIGALKDEMPSLRIAPSAKVVIRFDGRLEGVGRGQKTREAHATISKNGRVIFRYELPNETYKFGLPPAHAFARVLSDVFEE